MKQLTIRHVSPELAGKLAALSRSSGKSLNSTVLQVLSRALGVSERRKRLERYATWSREEAEAFDQVLREQRVIDEKLWS